MSLFSYLPLSNGDTIEVDNISQEAQAQPPPAPIRARAIKPTNVLSYFFSSSSRYKDRANFEDPPYDFVRIAKAVDTDSYAKQAFAKYKDLMWKEGWTITGQNPEAVDYIWRRIDLIEKAMNRPFQDIITEILDQLVKYSNVFIGVARTDLSKFVPEARSLTDIERQSMLAGLYVIPTEAVMVKRDQYNRPQQYAQKVEPNTLGKATKNGLDIIKWKAEDVIHLHLDRKPGRAFGTPFILPVLNDIISLRQLEEDILNLAHRELFPLYLYKVGIN